MDHISTNKVSTVVFEPATQEQIAALMAHRLRRIGSTERTAAVVPIAAVGATVAVASLGLQAVTTGVSVANMLKDSDSTQRVSMFEFRNMTGWVEGSDPLALMLTAYETDHCGVDQIFQTLLPGEIDVIGVRSDKGDDPRLTLTMTVVTSSGYQSSSLDIGFKFKSGEAWAPVVEGEQRSRQQLGIWKASFQGSLLYLFLFGAEAQASVSTMELWSMPPQ